MQLWCKIMNRCIRIPKLCMSVIAGWLAMALVSIPITYAMHTHYHSQGNDRYPINRLDQGSGVGVPQCGLCEFYVHYTPKDVDFRLSLMFSILPAFVNVQLEQAPCGIPRKESGRRHSNKGPPPVYNPI